MFAKLFETPTSQVLVDLQQDDETSGPRLRQTVEWEGGTVTASHIWNDTPEDWAKAQKALEEYDQERAEKVLKTLTDSINNMGLYPEKE